MPNSATSDTAVHRRNLIALGIIGFGTLAFAIAFSPAAERLTYSAPAKQIAAGDGR